MRRDRLDDGYSQSHGPPMIPVGRIESLTCGSPQRPDRLQPAQGGMTTRPHFFGLTA